MGISQEDRLTYTKVGDYYYPNIVTKPLPEEELTKFGIMRRDYLIKRKPSIHQILIAKGEFLWHCLEIQHQADQRLEELTTQMLKEAELAEEMKETDYMTFIETESRVRAIAEEIVLKEVVYV